MVAQPYYVAEMDGSAHIKYTDLRDSINDYGERRADRNEEKYGRGDSAAFTHVEVNDWAYGPLLYLEEFDSDGETRFPTLGNALCEAILEAGYVPWGFRPEMDGTKAGPREHTGRWMWYLRPVEDIVERDFYDVEYALKNEHGKYLRNADGDLLSFEERQDAEAVQAVENVGLEVVEVTN